MDYNKSFWAIVIIVAITAATRFAPFILLGGKKTPKAVSYFGKVLPFAAMGMLVVYCLRGISFSSPAAFLPELIAGSAVIASFALWRNTLCSILVGTVSYMLLVQFVFV